jgi:hypothetical protein
MSYRLNERLKQAGLLCLVPVLAAAAVPAAEADAASRRLA